MTDYRVNPALRVVPAFDDDPPGLVVEDLAANDQYTLRDRTLLAVLREFTSWTGDAEAVERLAERLGFDADDVAALVDQLHDRGFLVAAGDPAVELHEEGQRWVDDGWRDALEFYYSLYDHPYWEHEEVMAHMAEVQLTPESLARMPSKYKTYDAAETVDLPAVDGGDLPDARAVLGSGGRAGGADPLSRESLARVLYYAFGETYTGDDRNLFRTSPSGGARHPTEAYLVVVDPDVVPAGVYHYSVADHALERLDGELPEPLASTLAETAVDLGFRPQCVVFLTAVVERVMWRYQNPRAFRVAWHDAGHLVETLRLVCDASGLRTRYLDALPDSEVVDALGVDPVAEPFFDGVAVGPPE